MKFFKLSIAVLTGFLLAFSTVAFAKVSGDTITLGAAVSLTGKYSTNGKHTVNGYELAKDKINAAGGVTVGGKSYKIDIIYYDDESTPARAAQLAERLIKQDGVKYMLGPYSSGLTKAIAPVTEKYKIPMVEANGASRSLFTKGYRYLFAILTSADQYLASAVHLAADAAKANGKSASSLKIAMIFENDPFSQDVRLGVVEAYKEYGMKVVVDDKLPKNIDDMSASLAKVKATRPDILIVSGHAKGAATAIRQISQMRVDVPMLAMTHCDSAGYKEKFGNAAEYTLCAAQWHKSLSYSDALFGSGMDYSKTFQDLYNYDPPYQAAESSAAIQVWKDAFERAQSFDTEQLRDALSATKMQTFYGNISFDPTGKNLGKPMVLFQVLNGKYKVVSPPKWASTKLVHPRPNWSER